MPAVTSFARLVKMTKFKCLWIGESGNGEGAPKRTNRSGAGASAVARYGSATLSAPWEFWSALRARTRRAARRGESRPKALDP